MDASCFPKHGANASLWQRSPDAPLSTRQRPEGRDFCVHSTTPAENFRRGTALGGVLEAINDAHGRHDVPVARPTTANAGDCHVDGLVACWARLPAGTTRQCAIIALKRAGRRAIATARSAKEFHERQ